MTAIVPVILAGGAGTRLWPVSRETMPKHLARLVGDESLLQQTARRLLPRMSADRLITVAARGQDPVIRRQLAAIDPGLARHRLLEPVGRNTAAAIAFAALYAGRAFADDTVLWICPSDHLIGKAGELDRAVGAALPAAMAGDLVTFGITPTRPDTGYGYIRATAPTGDAPTVLPVDRFVEKPDLPTAEAMLAEGGYFWNSGMFLLRADRILQELAIHEPAIVRASERAFEAARSGMDGAIEVPRPLYEAIPSMPIDKAVMERAARIAVVPCDPDWTDLGSWHSIWERSAKDGDGNAARGDVVLCDVHDCLVHAGHRLVACAGVRDLAIIETDDALLVADRRRSETVKRVVANLNRDRRSEATRHSLEEHDWGQATTLQASAGCQVRRLEIGPRRTYGRREDGNGSTHWVVVAGTAELRQGDRRTRLGAGECAEMPPGMACELVNPGDTPLVLIETAVATREPARAPQRATDRSG